VSDDLTLRPLSTAHESYATIYEHPEFGKIDVGRIGVRSGNPHNPDGWSWAIGWLTLPGRHWAEGTAPTRKQAERAWKAHWPAFRDARSEADWHDAKTSQERSEKKLMLFDAGKLPGLTEQQRAELRAEAGRPGPAPHWLKELLRKA
jgi:hypothetical protein